MLTATDVRTVARVQHSPTTVLSLGTAPILDRQLTSVTPAPVLLLPLPLKVRTQSRAIAQSLRHGLHLSMRRLFVRSGQHESLALSMVSANRLLRRDSQRSGAVPRMSLYAPETTALRADLPDEVTVSTPRTLRVAAATDTLRVATRRHGHFSHVPVAETTEAHRLPSPACAFLREARRHAHVPVVLGKVPPCIPGHGLAVETSFCLLVHHADDARAPRVLGRLVARQSTIQRLLPARLRILRQGRMHRREASFP